jgi:branched-chain amino acid transport system permease protein
MSDFISQALGGLINGGVYAAIGVTVVFMYRMLGVVNFAQAAVGAIGGTTGLILYTDGWAALPSVVIGLVAGTLLAAAIGWIMASVFIEDTVELKSTVTIGLFVAMLAVGNAILGGSPHKFPDLLGNASLQMSGIGVPIGSLVECGGAILLAVILGWLLKHTRAGLDLRALAARPITAQLMGIRVVPLTVAVWASGGFIATLAIMLVLNLSTNSFSPMASFIVPALAAALLGLFRSMTVTAFAGIGLGIAQSLLLTIEVGPANLGPLSISSINLGRYNNALPFLLIIVVLMWWRRKDVWADAR